MDMYTLEHSKTNSNALVKHVDNVSRIYTHIHNSDFLVVTISVGLAQAGSNNKPLLLYNIIICRT